MSPQEFLREIAMAEKEWHAARGVIEIAAVGVGSISGALHGVRREYDLVGVTVIAVVSGVGGGIMRDIMLAQGPVLALRHPTLLLAALLGAAVGMLLGQKTTYLRQVFWLSDALALGLLTLAGIQRAEELGLRIIPGLFLGVLTGIGSGLLRDVLCRETPMVLMPGPPYAAASLFGGVVYYSVELGLGWPVVVCEWLGITAAFALRAVGTWRRWVMPRQQQLSQRLQAWRRGRQNGTQAPRQVR